jgi:hypothetical protein
MVMASAFLAAARRYRSRLDWWLREAMGIRGVPIPYGAPNANPHLERFHGTLREEGLNHFIFLSGQHVLRVCREYVEYYNRARSPAWVPTDRRRAERARSCARPRCELGYSGDGSRAPLRSRATISPATLQETTNRGTGAPRHQRSRNWPRY